MNCITTPRNTALSPEMEARLREHLPDNSVLEVAISFGTVGAIEDWLEYHLTRHRLSEVEILELLDSGELNRLRQKLGECVWAGEMFAAFKAELTALTVSERKKELGKTSVSVEGNRSRLRPTVFRLTALIDDAVEERILTKLDEAGFSRDLFSWSSIAVTCTDNRRFTEESLLEIRQAIQQGAIEAGEALSTTGSRHLSVA